MAILEDLSSAEGAIVVAARALKLLAIPFDVAGQPARVGVSIGVAVATDGSIDAADLIQEADLAMYQAKHDGKGRVVRSHGRAELLGTA